MNITIKISLAANEMKVQDKVKLGIQHMYEEISEISRIPPEKDGSTFPLDEHINQIKRK